MNYFIEKGEALAKAEKNLACSSTMLEEQNRGRRGQTIEKRMRVKKRKLSILHSLRNNIE